MKKYIKMMCLVLLMILSFTACSIPMDTEPEEKIWFVVVDETITTKGDKNELGGKYKLAMLCKKEEGISAFGTYKGIAEISVKMDAKEMAKEYSEVFDLDFLAQGKGVQKDHSFEVMEYDNNSFASYAST